MSLDAAVFNFGIPWSTDAPPANPELVADADPEIIEDNDRNLESILGINFVIYTIVLAQPWSSKMEIMFFDDWGFYFDDLMSSTGGTSYSAQSDLEAKAKAQAEASVVSLFVCPLCPWLRCLYSYRVFQLDMLHFKRLLGHQKSTFK